MPRPQLALIVNSLIVLAIAGVAVVTLAYEILIASPSDRVLGLLFALVFYPIVASFAACIYLSVFRRRLVPTILTSILYFGGAAFALFVLVGELGEALADSTPVDTGFFTWFGAITLCVTVYGVFNGILSVQWARQLQWPLRGRCSSCGYQLGGQLQCPECGTATP